MKITNNIDTYLAKHDSISAATTLISFTGATAAMKHKEHLKLIDTRVNDVQNNLTFKK